MLQVYIGSKSLELYHSHIFLILTVVDCGNLTDTANGSVNHTAGTTFGQTGTYSCGTGYNLVGDSNRTCQATGNWSGSAPTCEGMLLHSVYLWSFHESSEILLRPFLDYNDASRLLDDRLPYVAVPGRNRTLFCCIFRSHYCVRSTLAWNFIPILTTLTQFCARVL